MNPIQLFRPHFRVDECLAEIRKCLEVGWTGLGFKTIEFEEAWKKYTGLPHAHFLNSATAGLQIALNVLRRDRGWVDGSSVITTPLTFVSTNHAILHERLRPVFVDVDKHLCLDPDAIEEMISPWTRAVMFVGLGGNYGQLGRVAEICKKHGLVLILDASHMAGGKAPDGRHVGFEADATVFSFQAVKNLPTADSGMICFADPAHDEVARKLSWLGIDKDTYSRTLDKDARYKWKYGVPMTGFKAHGNSVIASLGLVGLRYLDHDNDIRRTVASWYEHALKGVAGVDLIPVTGSSSRHLFQILADRRDDLIEFLNSKKIYPGVHYISNQKYPMYQDLGGGCPMADYASDRIVSLPLHVELEGGDVDRVCDSIKEFYRT